METLLATWVESTINNAPALAVLGFVAWDLRTQLKGMIDRALELQEKLINHVLDDADQTR